MPRDYKPRRDGKRYKRTEHNIIEEAKEDIRYGYSILVIQQHLNRAGRVVSRFKDNLPGKEFAYSFFKRHSRILSERMCQNIK